MKFNSLLRFISVITILVFMIFTSETAEATGNNKTHWMELPSSGTGGVKVGYNSVNSLVASNCGGTYDIRHHVSFGAYNLSSFKFNTTSYSISNLTGAAYGGAAVLSNYETSSSNKWNYSLSGVRLSPGTTYNYNWYHSVPLGKYKWAGYDVSHVSGVGTSAGYCGTEESFMFGVGHQSSTSSTSTQNNEEFDINNNSLSESLGTNFNEGNRFNGYKSIVNQYYSNDDIVLLTQQEDSPIDIVNVNKEDYETFKKYGYNISLAKTKNYEGKPLTIIKFDRKNVYMALVTTLDSDEALELLKTFKNNK